MSLSTPSKERPVESVYLLNPKLGAVKDSEHLSIYAFCVVFIQDAYSASTVLQNLNFGTLKLFSLS